MFRVFVFLTALTLAVGPDASVLCQAWCGTEAATNNCGHGGSEQSPNLSAGDCCAGVEASVPATLAKDLLTKVSSPDATRAIPRHVGQSPRQPAEGRLGHEPSRPRPFDPAPLSTILRI